MFINWLFGNCSEPNGLVHGVNDPYPWVTYGIGYDPADRKRKNYHCVSVKYKDFKADKFFHFNSKSEAMHVYNIAQSADKDALSSAINNKPVQLTFEF